MNENQFGSRVRKRIMLALVVGMYLILLTQLVRMQILESSAYEEKSTSNSIKGIKENAPRGVLFDRNFKYLVSNKPSFAVEITPANYDRKTDRLLETVMGVDSGYIGGILKEYKRFSKYIPRKIMRDVSFNVIAWIDENKEKLDGVEYKVEMERDYSFGITGSHVFGYTKEISQRQYQDNKDKYDMGDYVGANGLESYYEDLLKGEKGVKYYVVDSRQKVVSKYDGGIHDFSPVKGDDLILTIDSAAQKTAEKAFEGKKGALVAIEPNTGEILAFVSAPQYDLSSFGTVTSNEVWKELNTNPDKPLFDRCTKLRNPPGSTFKMITTIAGLETGVISANDYINCRGGYQFGNRFFKCTHVHGKVNAVRAIEKSCNTYYYQLILKIGLDRWAKYGRMFGFGLKTGIDIGSENSGNLPDSKYYDRVYGKGKWTDGYLLSLGIGQGELITTPVQLAQYTAMLANFGVTKQPHFVKGYISSRENNFVELKYPEVKAEVSRKTMEIVREGMRRVVEGDGTARLIKTRGLEMAGKTGTAQNPHGEDHAWYIGFAPYDDPQIAVAVLVENVGFGSTHAAPIVRDVIKSYLRYEDKQTNSAEKE